MLTLADGKMADGKMIAQDTKLVAGEQSDKPHARQALPMLLALTDPIRAPDPFDALASLPAGAGLIWRAYDVAARRSDVLALARAARARGCFLLIAGQPALAGAADGLHLAGRLLNSPYTDRSFTRARRPKSDYIVTAAAHGEGAIIAAARAGVDAVLISPVFATKSHPGAAPLGVTRFARLAQFAASLGLGAYALGGVTSEEKHRRLAGSKLTGIAGIGFFADADQR